ncbi:MAG: sialidase family protein [Rhodocyclaceae bacterium]
MSFLNRVLVPSMFAGVLAGCASIPAGERAASSAAESVEIVSVSSSLPWNAHWTAVRAEENGYWLAWYADLPELNLSTPDGRVINLVDASDEEQAPSGLAAAVSGDSVWLAYRNKEPERDVFVRREGARPVEPFGISGDTKALARLRLHTGARGLEALWYGEQLGQENFYNLYYRQVDADGKAVGDAPELILPGLYPVWVNDDAGNQGVFSWVKDGQGSRIVSRARKAEERAFGDTVLIRNTTDSMTLPFDAFISGNRWFVYWIAQHGDLQDDYLIEGAWSDDHGTTWVPFDLEALRGVGIESISVAANGRDIVFAMAVAERGQARAEFRDVRVVRSQDNGATWSGAEKLRRGEAEYARARAPKVSFLDDNRVFVMWEDWREIRSRIRYALSEDGGRTWIVQDARLPVREEKSLLVNLFAHDVIPTGDGGVEVILEEMTDQYLRKELVSMKLDLAQLRSPVPDQVPTLDGLKERIAAYWTALINEEYRKAYNEIDPFFRARVDYAEYLQAMGRIEYDAFEIDEIRQEGHLAHVRQRVTAGVPPFFDKGKLVEVPKWARPVDTTWMWVDGQWVYEYKSDARAGFRFARY